MDRITQSSPRLLARYAALFFVLTLAGGIFAQGFVSDRLVVGSDAAATAVNILRDKALFRFSFTVFILEMASQVATSVLFYQLLKVVNRTVALLSLSMELTACVIKTFARVFYVAPLIVLGSSTALKGFSPEQLQSIALILLKVNEKGAGTASVFFGFSTALHGWLIMRSTFLPHWLGVLLLIAGLGWLSFLYPLGYPQFMIVAIFALCSCAVEIYWLLVPGVDEQRWQEQASVMGQ